MNTGEPYEFTREQVVTLEKEFLRNPVLSCRMKIELADEMSISEILVQAWFDQRYKKFEGSNLCNLSSSLSPNFQQKKIPQNAYSTLAEEGGASNETKSSTDY